MNFNEALELLKQGKKVNRIRWGAGCYICFDESNVLSEHVRIGDEWKEDDYLICKCDLLATDWEEYKDPLLTKEEKEYLKMLIKFHPNEIGSVAVSYRIDYKLVCLYYKKENEYVGCKGDQSLDYDCYTARKDDFKNLKDNNEYTLEELGLKD